MRPVLWYLAFVGIPLLALFGILRVGERLRPPRAVHGQYVVAFGSSGAGRCLSALVDGTQQRLGISQSGPRLAIAFGGLTFDGEVVGDSVQAAVAIGAASARRAADCLTGDTLRIAAVLDRSAAADLRLPGIFLFPACASCPRVPFRATRVAGRTREAGA